MISCKQVSTLVTSGELERQTAWKRFEIRIHLWMCRYCSRLARQMQQIREASLRLRSGFESEASSGGASDLETRILARVRNRPAAGGEPTK